MGADVLKVVTSTGFRVWESTGIEVTGAGTGVLDDGTGATVG